MATSLAVRTPTNWHLCINSLSKAVVIIVCIGHGTFDRMRRLTIVGSLLAQLIFSTAVIGANNFMAVSYKSNRLRLEFRERAI
jgi:hypothetical protein